MPPPIFPRAKPSSGKKNQGSLVVTLLLFSPVLLLFFISGIYFGSSFVDSGGQSSTSQSSLPGTKNVVMKWGSQHLRGLNMTPPLMQGLLRHSNNHPTLSSEGVLTSGAGLAAQPISMPQGEPHIQKSIPDGVPVTSEESHPISGAEHARHLAQSMHVRDNVAFEGPSTLDASNLVIGAWVYLDPLAVEGDMRTIFTNKDSGCEGTPDRFGVAMYVNEWETSNHELYVEFGNTVSGCHKVSSNGIQLMPTKWYHVAVSLIGQVVELYIDGTVVGRSDLQTHTVQSARAMVVGSFGGGKYPLHGNISHFAVAHPDPGQEDRVVRTMMHAADRNKGAGDGLLALFEFSDFSSAVSAGPDSAMGKKETFDAVSGLKGMYFFPARVPPGRGVSGVGIALVDGVGGRLVTDEMREESDRQGRIRREEIKRGMATAWDGYRKHAWGRDELKPATRTGGDPWGGMGVTLVDSLDTLWVMGMKKEFDEATEWVRQSLSFSRVGKVSVFETTIRELGGLLSAYDLSGSKVFLEKAKDLGNRLIRAFDGGIGLPRSQVDLSSGYASSGWSGGSAILSELGTLQVEFRYLSHITGDPSYEKTSMRALQVMNQRKPPHGLFPIKVSISNGQFTDKTVTFGALGDSFYEYLLKVWLQGGRQENWLREMYDNAIEGVIGTLLKASKPSGLAFLSDWDGRHNNLKMDHLVCFMPGTMTLGAYTDPQGLDSPRAQRDLAVAKALMYTCREMYHRTATGIAPEFVTFQDGRDMVTRTSAPFYILRPETAESLFVMNQLTGDPIYREWAWEIWTAIDKHCKLGAGYGSLRDVNNAHSGVDNRMESFFLAETMKYLYLAQDPDNEMDLMKYVFNTEAHPTRMLDPNSHRPIPPY